MNRDKKYLRTYTVFWMIVNKYLKSTVYKSTELDLMVNELREVNPEVYLKVHKARSHLRDMVMEDLSRLGIGVYMYTNTFVLTYTSYEILRTKNEQERDIIVKSFRDYVHYKK